MSAMLFNEFVVAATAEEAVERLSVLHRQAREALSQALRRYLKERTHVSVAKELGISATAVRKHILHALDFFRKKLPKNGE